MKRKEKKTYFKEETNIKKREENNHKKINNFSISVYMFSKKKDQSNKICVVVVVGV